MASSGRCVSPLVVFLVCLVLAVGLTSCTQTPDMSDVFVEESSWQGDVPDGAATLSPSEFYTGVKNGSLTITVVGDEADQRAAFEAQFEADLLELQSVTAPSTALLDLLEAADGAVGSEPGASIEVGGEVVTLMSIGERVVEAAASVALAADPENALADYRMSYDLLPDFLKAEAFTPESLEGASIGEIADALSYLDGLLGFLDDQELDGTYYDPLWMDSLDQYQTPVPGRDQDDTCAAPTGYFANYWFPLRNFLSPMKNQRMRFTCWAFAAIGAIESRERVQNDNPVDLSEQFFVNQSKYVWARSDFVESHSSNSALASAVATAQRLPSESFWPYNPSLGRTSSTDGEAKDFVGSCKLYAGGACSQTAHQSAMVCTLVSINGVRIPFCGYRTATYSGSGPLASTARQIWSSGQTFDLRRYRQYLSEGHVIIASHPVYNGFSNAVGGVVSDYTRECNSSTGGVTKKCGGHVVQIVGFLSNADLAGIQGPTSIGGGGYFIIKNSWGCRAGDGGYYYVPADYVERIFSSMSVLEFGMRRGTGWNVEQATPGRTEAPVITLGTTPPARRADLRVSVNLAQFFKVTHSSAATVNLRVQSSISGTVYDGPFYFRPGPLTPPNLPVTFTAAGNHDLTVTATHAGRSASINFNMNVVNTPPDVRLSGDGTGYIGFVHRVSASVADPNESSTAGMCSRMTWTVVAPDTVTGSGCTAQVNFVSEGSRTITASTTDTEGRIGTDVLTVNVRPEGSNPYPQITAFGVFRRDQAVISGQPVGCIDFSVSQGTTIDLRDSGCVLAGQPSIPRYSATVTVNNPQGEALSYSWRLTATHPNGFFEVLNATSNDPSSRFLLVRPRANTGEALATCRVEVTVNAPDPARSKSATVWTGPCRFWSFYLG